MSDSQIPRLNGVIKALEEGRPAFLSFVQPDQAAEFAEQPFDGVVYEMEHGIYSPEALRDALQNMLNRRQIVERASLAPAVTPLVRIPPNGSELSSWIAKQVLDIGVYGIVWPHVSTVEEARNAVAACRYPRREGALHYDPPGIRGDAPTRAARYWGLTLQEYYERADVWPLAPKGEILVCIMCEELKAIKNLPRMLGEVPGIGVVLIGEGDLSQELGCARQYDNPELLAAMAEIRAICKAHNVPVGHPHVNGTNVEQLLNDGYRWLMVGAETSFNGLQSGRKLAGRA